MKHEDFFAKILSYFSDPTVHELCLNGTRALHLFKNDRTVQSDFSPFSMRSELIRSCQSFAQAHGQRLDPLNPAAGGYCVDGGFRWHCLIAPACVDGAIFSLRRHRFADLTLEDFAMLPSHRQQLEDIFSDAHNNILFCGPTGSGKTTLLASFLKHYAWNQRVIMIEEVSELPCLSPHWLSLSAKPKDIEGRGELRLSFLIEESLRLRPDRLVLGEIRTIDALVFFETLMFGHQGSLATIHAANAEEVRSRISALLCLRGSSANEFWSALGRVPKLWYVFLERGSPPRVVDIVAH